MSATQLDFFADPAPTLALPPKPKKQKTEWTCALCAMTWAEGCARPDWSWVDEGYVGMSACDRCGRIACHHCRVRDGFLFGAICAECFDLPEPTDAELRAHSDVTRGQYSVERLRARLAWRYAEPTGQSCSTNPAIIRFWQDRAAGNHAALPEKQIEAMFRRALHAFERT